MTDFRKASLIALAAPLALALAACGDSAGDAATAGAEPIDPIAAPAGQSWIDTAAVTPEGGVVVGNPDAPLKLVEYASHTCSHCAAFAEEAHGNLDKYIESGVVSYELRNQIHDAIDLTVAMLARCGGPTTFKPLSDQVWANLGQVIEAAQANGEALNAAMMVQDDTRFQQIAAQSGLLDFFAARGVSRDQAMQCLADTSQAEQIVNNSQTQSEELEVTGTPTFFLNGNRIDGTAWSIVEPALQAAGARSDS